MFGKRAAALTASLCLGIVVTGFFSASIAYASPEVITLLEERDLYDQAGSAGPPVGRLSSYQAVEVVSGSGREINGQWWSQIHTWLGDKWIMSGDSVMPGTVKEVNKVLNTLRNEYVYDKPNFQSIPELHISAQPVTVTAINESCYTDPQGKQICSQPWYRIQTWLGEKWLNNPKFKENIVEEPVQKTVTLTGEENLYVLPYAEQAAGSLAPQKVNVVAEWNTGDLAYRFKPVIWYKIQTDNGLRWMYPKHLVLFDVEVTEETIDLPTGANAYDLPEYGAAGKVWVQPGTVQAFEKWQGWYHIRTNDGDKWINPDLALKERPIGTVDSAETITIDETTASYYFPGLPSIAHDSGFYAKQEVPSIAKWISPDGGTWYLIRGFDGDVWVKP